MVTSPQPPAPRTARSWRQAYLHHTTHVVPDNVSGNQPSGSINAELQTLDTRPDPRRRFG